MTQSMTAFASVHHHIEGAVFSWEIRSVNHRYLDLSFRLPESLRFLEPALTAIVRRKLSRGKIECQLKCQDTLKQTMIFNEKLVTNLLEVSEKLAQVKQLPNDLTLTTILNWPGVLQLSTPNLNLLEEQVKESFEAALTTLVELRQREGKALEIHIKSRLGKLVEEIAAARMLAATISSQQHSKLLDRLANLELEVDNARLEQEIALILTRLDVGEELDRLDTHALEIAKTLESTEATGRRLDFLMQELNREANTLSAKSNSVNLTQHAVEMKVLIEQMREQIQNIE